MDDAAVRTRLQAGTILWFIAGFFVSLEVFVALAFMHGGRSILTQATLLPPFVALAVGTLALAALVWPGNRLLVLGKTILIGAAIPALTSITVYTTVPPSLLTWKLGLINLLLVVGLGLLLYRMGGGGLPPALQRKLADVETFLRASFGERR